MYRRDGTDTNNNAHHGAGAKDSVEAEDLVSDRNFVEVPDKKNSTTTQEPSIDQITKWDLEHDVRLEKLYRQFVVRKFIHASNMSFFEFVAYAEKALEEDKIGTPGRLFYSLIKESAGRIYDHQEERAMQRFPSYKRDEVVARLRGSQPLVESNSGTSDVIEMSSSLGDYNVGYLPVAMVQCFFPQKRLPSGTQKWQVNHGRTALMVRNGDISDRDNPGQYRVCDIPHGSLSRLLTTYVIGQSVKTGSQNIDMGHSLRDCLSRLNIPVDGPAGKRLTKAVEDFASSSIIIGHWGEDGSVRTSYARIVNSVSFWIEPNLRQKTFWNPELILSRDFHDQIQEHRVPVNMDHLKALSKSPRRMDLYVWLAYRCSRIPRGGRVTIRLSDLQSIFAPDIRNLKHFKQKLKEDLKAIGSVFNYNTRIDGDMLILSYTPPPLPYKTIVQKPK